MIGIARLATTSAGPVRILAAAVVAQTAVSVIDLGIPTVTGFVKSDLALSAATAGLLIAAFPAGKVFGSYLSGVAADRIGERIVLGAGAIITGLVVLASTLTPFIALLFLLAVAGIAGSTTTPAGGRLVLVAFPSGRRGLAMGIRQTGIPLGGLVAAVLLPPVAASVGWRDSLGVAGGIAVLGGLATIAVAGIESATDRRSLRSARPVGAHRPSRDRNILLMTSWGCLLIGGQYVLVAFLPVYLYADGGTSLRFAVLVLVLAASAQGGAIVGRIVWGVVSDRLTTGSRPLMLTLSGIGVCVMLLLTALPSDAPVGVFAGAAFLGGMSVMGWQGIFVRSIGEIAGAQSAGAATGFALTFLSLAVVVSPPLYGLVADLSGSYRAMWFSLALVILSSILPAALVKEPTTTTPR